METDQAERYYNQSDLAHKVHHLSDGSVRDAIFPDFSGIPDFHKSKSSMKKWKDLASYCCFINEDVLSALT